MRTKEGRDIHRDTADANKQTKKDEVSEARSTKKTTITQLKKDKADEKDNNRKRFNANLDLGMKKKEARKRFHDDNNETDEKYKRLIHEAREAKKDAVKESKETYQTAKKENTRKNAEKKVTDPVDNSTFGNEKEEEAQAAKDAEEQQKKIDKAKAEQNKQQSSNGSGGSGQKEDKSSGDSEDKSSGDKDGGKGKSSGGRGHFKRRLKKAKLPSNYNERDMKRYFANNLKNIGGFEGLKFTQTEIDRLFASFSDGRDFADIATAVFKADAGTRGQQLSQQARAGEKNDRGSFNKLIAKWNNSVKKDYAQTRGINPDDIKDASFSWKDRKSPDATQADADARETTPQFDPRTGQMIRGMVKNAGGGKIDTEVGTDQFGNDKITKGPQNLPVATKTLRGKFPQASGDRIDINAPKNLQSDVLFEAFSWVPDGYGLGPGNKLGRLNLQHDNLRYGMEVLNQPRREETIGHPHPIDGRFSNDMPLCQVAGHFMDIVAPSAEAHAIKRAADGQSFSALDDDVMSEPSALSLPRRVITPFEPVIRKSRVLLPWKDSSGVDMNALPYTNTRSGTYRKRKLDVYGVDLI